MNPCRGLVAQHLRRFSVWPKKSTTLTPVPSPGGRGEKRVLVPELWLVIQPPINTVPVAMTVPMGASAGSLQVIATSPLRAAGLPPICTVALPS